MLGKESWVLRVDHIRGISNYRETEQMLSLATGLGAYRVRENSVYTAQ